MGVSYRDLRPSFFPVIMYHYVVCVFQVELDDRGNRLGMDVSFWQLDGRTLEGVSYVQGIEAARYSSATRKVQVWDGL